MSTYRLTPAAQQDLSSTWDFTEERWSLSQAETYIRELQAAIERIAEDPHRGRARDDVREGHCNYAIGSHAIFYRPRADGVDVIRILHLRMDYGRHL